MRPIEFTGGAMMLRAALLALLAAVLSTGLFTGARAEPSPGERESARCADAITAAEKAYDLPAGLMASIAKAESGRPLPGSNRFGPWPWTIDADGEGAFYDDARQAVAAVGRFRAAGAQYIDVGCMQVDLLFHPDAFRTLAEAFDPATNVDYAARLLTRLHDEANGNWWVAVGLYHSHTPDLAAEYRERVAAAAGEEFAPVSGGNAVFPAGPGRVRLRLTLATGRSVMLVFRRSVGVAALRRKNPCQIAAALSPEMVAPLKVSGCRGASPS